MVESKVREGVRRRRIGEIVRRHIHGLHGGDRTLGRRGDALLERAHFGGERRLVTDRRRRAAEERGHFGTGLREAEDVVDEEEHVLVLLVAEIFRHRERGERDAETRAGRLVHLAVDERDLGLAEVLLVDDAGLAHFVVEIVALAGALADAGEDGETAVALGDVVDEFEDDDGLADARATERADFAALGERADEVDDLDAGFEDVGLRVLIDERRGRAVNRVALVVRSTGPRSSTGSPVTLKMRPRTPSPTGTEIGAPVAVTVMPRLRPSRAAHRDRAHPAFAEVLLHFEDELGVARR